VPAPSATPPGPGEPWTLLRLILWSAGYLIERGVEQGRLDAEHLLAHALGTGRLQLYLQHDRPLTPAELAAFKPLLLRRADREPLQYILGRTGFRELDLATDPRGLIPRPETEVLVEVVLDWARRRVGDERTLSAADVGTGTGCIALSLAREGPFRRVLATDRTAPALELAAENARSAGLEAAVELRLGDLLEPLAGERFDALVSNPPYIANAERAELEPEVRDFEPSTALFAGADGLDVIRALVRGAADHLRPSGLLALEVGAGQTKLVSALIERERVFEAPRVHRDLSGRPRIVAATLRVGAKSRECNSGPTRGADPNPRQGDT
jgi:release factor glutamine methyltransferase